MVAHQGRIYVGGGFGEDKAILCSVESYDPDTDKVSLSPHMAIFFRKQTFSKFSTLKSPFEGNFSILDLEGL